MGARGNRGYFNLYSFQVMKKIFFPLILSLGFALTAKAQMAAEVRFGNEAADTTRIGQMLDLASKQRLVSPEARIAYFAKQFEGTPYAAHTLEGPVEVLTVRLDSLDCTTFVDISMALAYTIGERRTSWRDFVYNLRRLRYRNGEVDGYASRLHYISDWVVDNRHRGNIQDATEVFPRSNHLLRTIDFMSRNRDKYPALADSANFERIKAIENGYRLHRFPYIKSGDLGDKATKKAFKSGDVVALVTTNKTLDVTHLGIIIKNAAGEPYLLHASSTDGMVEMSKQPLCDFMKRNRQWLGLRVIRLTDY